MVRGKIAGEEIVEEVFAEDYDEPAKTDPVSPEVATEAPVIEQEDDNDFVREVNCGKR